MKHLILSILSGFRGLAWNTAAGTHPNGCISLKAEEVVATRHLLVSRGSASDGCLITDAGDLPLGVMDDEADSDDVSLGTPKNVQLLGVTPGTILMVAAGAIAQDAAVYALGNGKVDEAAAAATGDYRVGIALNAATADGDLVEVAHELPTYTKPA